MENQKEYYRHILLFYFRKGKNASQARKKLWKNGLKERQCQNCFDKFRSGELHVSHTCIENHLKQLGYVQKLDTWVAHELREKHLTQRINSCDLLKKRNENDPFLKRPITGDEKWVVCNNIERKRWWSRPREPARTTPKDGIRRKKVLLSVWLDYKGIVYFELLPPIERSILSSTSNN